MLHHEPPQAGTMRYIVPDDGGSLAETRLHAYVRTNTVVVCGEYVKAYESARRAQKRRSRQAKLSADFTHGNRAVMRVWAVVNPPFGRGATLIG